MEKVFIDENGEYGLDYSKAIWASDQMHQIYQEANVPLSDADFFIEDTDFVMVIEYKNANTEKAIEMGYKTKAFNPMDAGKLNSVVRKFYDSCHYLHLLDKSKPVRYIYVVETPTDDSTMRKRLRDQMKTLLPFALQQNINTGIKLIEKVDVVSIKEWNADSTYGNYPLIKINRGSVVKHSIGEEQ